MAQIEVDASQVPTVLNVYNIQVEESVAKAIHDKLNAPAVILGAQDELALMEVRDKIGVALAAMNPLPPVD